jgi:glycosyltransferase involved in cell wall biosynthesis
MISMTDTYDSKTVSKTVSKTTTINSGIRITVITSLFNCEQYLNGYLNALCQISNPTEVEVLLLHNAPTQSELEIIERLLPKISCSVQHLCIEREGLYTTWNRGITLAQGSYIAIWNVDDRRSFDSLEKQAHTLDFNPNALLTYGNYLGVQHAEDTTGTLYELPEFSKRKFSRHCLLSPFPMWRKDVHTTIGYFDESMCSASDYDFQLRIVHSGNDTSAMVQTSGILGTYLEAHNTGISKSGDWNNIERTVCELRYGILDKVNILYIPKALRYSLTTLRQFGKPTVNSVIISQSMFSRIASLVVFPLSLFRLPINIARYIKHRLLPSIKSKFNS